MVATVRPAAGFFGPYTFDTDQAKDLEALTKQSKNRGKILIVNKRTTAIEDTFIRYLQNEVFDGEYMKDGVKVTYNDIRDIRNIKYTVINPNSRSVPKSIDDADLAVVLGKRRHIILTQNSFLSNFEPAYINSRKYVFASVEQCFQCAKVAFFIMKFEQLKKAYANNNDMVSKFTESIEYLQTLASDIKTTDNPEYMGILSMYIKSNDKIFNDVLNEWFKVRFRLLEAIMYRKVTCHPKVRNIIHTIFETLDIPKTNQIEIWHCKENDDIYGINISLRNVLINPTIPEDVMSYTNYIDYLDPDNNNIPMETMNVTGKILTKIIFGVSSKHIDSTSRPILDRLDKLDLPGVLPWLVKPHTNSNTRYNDLCETANTRYSFM